MQDLTTELIKATSLLNRVNSDTYDTLISRLDKIQALINAEIMKYDTLTPKLKKFINDAITEVYSDFDEIMIKDIEDVVEVAYDKTGLIMGAVAGVSVVKWKDTKQSVKDKLFNPNKNILAVGGSVKDLKKQLPLSQYSKIRKLIADGFESDITLTEMQRQSRAIVNNETAFESIKRRDLDTDINTIMLGAINEAKQESFKTFEGEEWFTGYKFSGIFDNRQSDVCRYVSSINYTCKTMEECKYRPPLHRRCRSMLIPITIYDEPTEKPATIWDKSQKVNHRASTGGGTSTKFKVDKSELITTDTTYKQWYNTLNKEDKISILGKTRVDLIDKNKISFEDAVKLNNNDRLSIKELKEKFKL